MPDHRAVDAYIDAHLNEHIANLQELVRQPSISHTGEGIAECAQLLAGTLKRLGCQTVEIVPTKGHPVVFGRLDAGKPRTLIAYSMYDVQPADEPDWSVPPFEGRLADRPPYGRCLLARGARNTKGPLRSFLNAVDALNQVDGSPPVNLMFVLEGEEEQGSRHLPDFVNAYQEQLRQADAVLFPHAIQNDAGKGMILLGNKGLVYLELECSGELWGKGPHRDAIHSSYKAVVDSPAWRLIHALSTLTTPDGNHITIDGFYDRVKPPTPADEELMANLVGEFDPDHVGYGVRRYIDDLTGIDLIRRDFFSTCLNIDGIWGGYTGPGSKTVLPHKVTAKLDVRLVPDQEPQEIVDLIRRHLDKHGYTDIQITILGMADWAKCSVLESLPQAAIRAYAEFGVKPEVWPLNPGTLPFAVFNRPPLSLPICAAGLGRSGRSHAADEYFVIDGTDKVFGLADFEKSLVAILYQFANQPAH